MPALMDTPFNRMMFLPVAKREPKALQGGFISLRYRSPVPATLNKSHLQTGGLPPGRFALTIL